MPLTMVEEINHGALSMQVASAAVEDGDWQMAREALREAGMHAIRALYRVDRRLESSGQGSVRFMEKSPGRMSAR